MIDDDNARLAERLRALESEVARLRGIVEGDGAASRVAAPPAEPIPEPQVEPAPVSVAPPRQRTDEVSLVGPWLARIGAVALVLGAGFGFKYAIDSGLIGPTARVVLGLLAGGVLLAGGEWARRKTWHGWAQAVSGGAIGIWYLSVWAAYQLYGLISSPLALAGFSAISVTGAILALRHRSEPLAVLATATAFLNPFLVGPVRTLPVDSYVLVVDIGVLATAFRFGWPLLGRVALAGTWIAASTSAGIGLFDGPDPGLTVPLSFGAVFFLLFLGRTVARALAERASPRLTDVLTVNSFIFLGYGLVLLDTHADEWRGAFAAAMGILHLAVAAPLLRARGLEFLVRGLALLGSAFIAIAVSLQFDGPTIPALWTVEALVLFAIGHASRSWMTRAAGLALLLIAVVWTYYYFELFQQYAPTRLLLSGESLTFALQVAVPVVMARLISSTDSGGGRWRQVLIVLAHLVAIQWLSRETAAAFLTTVSHGVSGLPLYLIEERAFAMTAVWALYAAGTLIGGVIARSPLNRLVAVGLFGAVIFKLVSKDLWLVGPLYRTIAFIGLGVVLLASSLLYHRFRDFILGEQNA